MNPTRPGQAARPGQTARSGQAGASQPTAPTATRGPRLAMARETLRTELTEVVGLRRTWRGPTLLVAVLLTAVGSPLAARFMPEILASSLASAGGNLVLPEPTVADAWAQWVKNASSLLLVVLVIIVAASLAGERASGVAAAALAGGRSRTSFVVAKALAHLVVAAAATIGGTLVCAVTIGALYDGELAPARGLAATALWLLWALDVLALTLLVSAASRATVLPAAVGVAASLLAPTAALWEPLARWTPLGLNAMASEATAHPGTLHVAPIATGLVLAVGLVAAACLTWRRVEL